MNGEALISVEAALAAILEAAAPLPEETAPLDAAFGRHLARDLAARRTQPPMDVSAMDGYAIRPAASNPERARYRIIGASAAGRPYKGEALRPGEAVRIFTGAGVPLGADRVVPQEVADTEGTDRVVFRELPPAGRHIRPRGLDFRLGDHLLPAGTRLDAGRLALAAAMNHAAVRVHRRPRVVILATGDELVPPGLFDDPQSIVASNTYAVAALSRAEGAEVVDIGLAPDRLEALVACLDAAIAHRPDVLVTLGGASVGDHDLTQAALTARGFALGFWRVSMRPGKPLIHGRLGPALVLGLPGNPVSALVCAEVFLRPLLRRLAGDPRAAQDRTRPARLAEPLPANDHRQDYVRARLVGETDGLPLVAAFPRQDSSMLSTMAQADALIVRPPHAPAAASGEPCRILPLG